MADAATAPKPIDPNVAQDLARLMLDLSHDKSVRKDIGRLVKKAKPDSPHAAAFADVDVEDKFETFRQEHPEKEVKAQQQLILDRMNHQRRKLLEGDEGNGGRKYSEEDVGKIEALMQKKGLTDYDDAAVLYAATLPPENSKPSPEIPKHGATWEFPEWSKFGEDPNKAARNTAYEVIAEFQRKQR
jgi:hypothetical protein